MDPALALLLTENPDSYLSKARRSAASAPARPPP